MTSSFPIWGTHYDATAASTDAYTPERWKEMLIRGISSPTPDEFCSTILNSLPVWHRIICLLAA
jgi:hypothetical protein